VFSLIIDNPHVVIMETGVFISVKEEASDRVVVLLSEVDEVLTVLLLWVSVVYNHTLALFYILFSDFVAFLLGFE
jgi:hypothetical protein